MIFLSALPSWQFAANSDFFHSSLLYERFRPPCRLGLNSSISLLIIFNHHCFGLPRDVLLFKLFTSIVSTIVLSALQIWPVSTPVVRLLWIELYTSFSIQLLFPLFIWSFLPNLSVSVKDGPWIFLSTFCSNTFCLFSSPAVVANN